jgi:hypothetical protein
MVDVRIPMGRIQASRQLAVPDPSLPPPLYPSPAIRRAASPYRCLIVVAMVFVLSLGANFLATPVSSSTDHTHPSLPETAVEPSGVAGADFPTSSTSPIPAAPAQPASPTAGTGVARRARSGTQTRIIITGPAPPTVEPAPPTTPPAAIYGIPPSSEPPESPTTPTPDFRSICYTDGENSAPCISAGTRAIDTARQREGLGPIRLPTNYAVLSPNEQVFVLTNIERVDRGLPPYGGLVDDLNLAAVVGANSSADPFPGAMPPGTDVLAWRSNWAYDASPLHADYFWMYADGPGGTNIDCQPGNMSGCWVHRDNILWNIDPTQLVGTTLVMGAAQTMPASLAPNLSLTELFALVTGTPADTYTWAQAVAAGAA